MNSRMKKIIAITVAMIGAYIISSWANGLIFEKNSARINKVFLSYIRLKLKGDKYHLSWSDYQAMSKPIIILKKEAILKMIKEANKEVAPGIYAGEHNKARFAVIRLDQVKNNNRENK